MNDISTIDEEVLRLIARLEAVGERDMQDAMSQLAARQWVLVIEEFDVPGALSDSTVSLIAQLQRALPPVPDEGWRSRVLMLAVEAKRQLLASGKGVRS